jgi:hypothetical protein
METLLRLLPFNDGAGDNARSIYNVGGEIVLLITLEVFLLPAITFKLQIYVLNAGIQSGLGILLVVSILELGDLMMEAELIPLILLLPK